MPDAPSSPAVALVVVHRLPDDPPKGDMERAVLRCYDSETYALRYAGLGTLAAESGWWSELPVPPVEGALTLDHLTCAVAACELVVRDLRESSQGRSPNIGWYEECADALRLAIAYAAPGTMHGPPLRGFIPPYDPGPPGGDGEPGIETGDAEKGGTT